MLPDLAGSAATLRFAARFPAPKAARFYHDVQGLTVSSVGIGTYRDEMDAATDRAYAEAVTGTLAAGVNFIDTSLNYRNQRSERGWEAPTCPIRCLRGFSMPPQPREPGSLHRAATRSRAVNPNRDRKGVGACRLAFAEVTDSLTVAVRSCLHNASFLFATFPC
jgi:hypothetical protein